MNKVFTLAVMLIATAFFSLTSIDVNAQCENGVKGKHITLVSQTNSFENKGGELWLVGIQSSDLVDFPCYFEWRKEDTEGEIISSGIVENAIASPTLKDEAGKIANLTAGKYVLIVYDNSIPCKKSEKIFEIQ